MTFMVPWQYWLGIIKIKELKVPSVQPEMLSGAKFLLYIRIYTHIFLFIQWNFLLPD